MLGEAGPAAPRSGEVAAWHNGSRGLFSIFRFRNSVEESLTITRSQFRLAEVPRALPLKFTHLHPVYLCNTWIYGRSVKDVNCTTGSGSEGTEVFSASVACPSVHAIDGYIGSCSYGAM